MNGMLFTGDTLAISDFFSEAVPPGEVDLLYNQTPNATSARAVLEERAKRGPPRGAPEGGKWMWKRFSEPSTLLFCIPWSKSVEKLAYRARDGTFWSD